MIFIRKIKLLLMMICNNEYFNGGSIPVLHSVRN